MAQGSQRPSTDNVILVVDDEEEVLTSLRCLLEREGHRVLTAESGERAIALLKQHDIHLLLVDYFMPHMSGEDLIRHIRAFDPYVQIILQTGHSGKKPASQMMAALDIQGYHDKGDGPGKLLLWVNVGLKAFRSISKLRERERERSEIIANASHELRSPLSVMCGFADLLLDSSFGPMPEEARRPLRALKESTSRLNKLVGNFLLHAKLEARAMQANRTWVPILGIAQELRALGSFLLDGTDVEFTVDLHQAPGGVLTDGALVRTILHNLIDNAVKFTRSGAISVRVGQDGDTVRLAVQDTGIGIAPENQELIFEPFRQVDGSTTRTHGGVGLGLALSRKLARLLGGDLEVDSELGVGSTIVLTLPATDAIARPVNECPAPQPAARCQTQAA